MSYPVFYPPASTVLYIPFATYAGSTGASITLTGLAVTDIEIYKNGSVTQRASDNGYTLLDTDGIDFDGTTGIHGISIDLADNSDSGFYAVGSWYFVVVSSVTVDSQTVNFIAGAFRIAPAESSAGTPKVDVSHFGGTAGTFSGGRPEVNTTHAAGTAWNSAAISASTLAADTITNTKIAADAITAAKIADGAIDRATFAADTGLQSARSNTAQAGGASTITLDASAAATDNYYNDMFVYLTGGTGQGQGRYISDYDGTTKVATVNTPWTTNPNATTTFAILPAAFLDFAGAVWGALRANYTTADTFGQGVSGVYGSMTGSVAGSVGSVTAAVTVGDIESSPLAEIQSEVTTALGLVRLDELLAADSDIDGAAPPTVGSVFHELMTKTTGSFTYDQTTDSLEALRDNAGTAGAGLTAVPWNAAWDAEVESEANDALIAQNLDHLVKVAVDTNFATTVHLDSVVGQLADAGGTATFDRTTDALEVLGAGVVVGSINAGAITAAAIATGAIDDDAIAANAITAAKVADGTIDAATFAAGAINAAAIAADAITAAKVADGTIDAATFAAGAINAAAIATDAITADKLAADAIGSSELSDLGVNKIVDALLKRDLSAVTGEAARSVLNALRFLRNKWSISGTTLTVTKEDDATTAWTSSLTTSSSANSVTGSDPS
jgi:hypothetical protein